MTLTGDRFFSRHFLWLKFASAFYVAGIIFGHITWGAPLVWPIAVFFSIAMNFTYPWAAITTGTATRIEMTLSTILILLSLLGLIYPLAVIAAIFAHGCWDLMKRCGHGVAFFGWYVSGCVVVDWTYAITLFIYWQNT